MRLKSKTFASILLGLLLLALLSTAVNGTFSLRAWMSYCSNRFETSFDVLPTLIDGWTSTLPSMFVHIPDWNIVELCSRFFQTFGYMLGLLVNTVLFLLNSLFTLFDCTLGYVLGVQVGTIPYIQIFGFGGTLPDWCVVSRPTPPSGNGGGGI